MGTIPTRFDQELFDTARASGQLHSRSAAQQLAHWARIGRQLEASPAVSHDQVARVLAGESDYDTLDERSQAVVRAAWDERVAERTGALDLEGRLVAAGGPWPEADEHGTLVVRTPPAG